MPGQQFEFRADIDGAKCCREGLGEFLADVRNGAKLRGRGRSRSGGGAECGQQRGGQLRTQTRALRQSGMGLNLGQQHT